MTNTTYFYNTIWEHDSDSSSQSQPPDDEHNSDPKVVEALSFYSLIGKACLSCARPPAELTDSRTPTSQSECEIFKCSPLKSFSFAELTTATGGFCQGDALAGSFGSVFKGWIDEHTTIAIKRGTNICIAVKLFNKKGFQNHLQWLERLNDLGQLYHPNLVRLFGYCLEDSHWALVYEFMPRGSLEDHLLRIGVNCFRHFPWSTRMKIALGAAEGLAFLHSAKEKNLHGNFRPSNILLDENYNAKLTDFGLTRDGLTNHPVGIMETVCGPDLGYCSDYVIIHDAPEYLTTGRATTKSDVYSFGVVLLKLLYGGRAVENFWKYGENNLAEWAKQNLVGKMYPTVGNHFVDHYMVIGAGKVSMLAHQCLSMYAKDRPDMDEVVESLKEVHSRMVKKH